MALKFKGREGVENFVNADGKTEQRPRQCFRSGMIKITEMVPRQEDVFTAKLDAEGKPMKDKEGNAILEKTGTQTVIDQTITAMRVTDIGKTFDHWHNEDDVLARYPLHFKKV